MSKWNSREWTALYRGEACPICRAGKPQDIIREMTSSYLTSSPHAPMRGYCCLVLKHHAVELYELDREDANGLMRDIQHVARAIQEITGAVKMNYEIHGNTIPHLHVHLFPRYPGDPFEGGPINPQLITASPYGKNEFADFIGKLQSRFQQQE